MAFDGLFLSAIREELLGWVGSKVDRIYQPDKDTVLLHLRKAREIRKLLISIHAEYCRIHFTEADFLNPPEPPLFCMVLRKHLSGAVLAQVEQPGLERVLKFVFQAKDELGRPLERYLVSEIMGKHSNLLLLDPSGPTIIDALRRYTHAVSRYREVLPGREYVPPPYQGKQDPRELGEDLAQLIWREPLDKPLKEVLVERLEGIGPLTAREIIYRAGLPEDVKPQDCGEYELVRLHQALEEVLALNRPPSWEPTVVRDPFKGALAFAAFDLKQFTGFERERFTSPSQACEAFYKEKQIRHLFISEKRSLTSLVERELKRCLKKEAIQAEAVASAEEASRYRLYGELIMANIYRLKKGDRQLTTENFYEAGSPEIVIELDPALTPTENAARYFQRYQKAKNAAQKASEQLKETREEIAYLNSVMQALEMAEALEDLKEIREELVRSGYLEPAQQNKKAVQAPSKKAFEPLKVISSDGFTILIGKNNRQNDLLSLKVADDEDIWLHAKDVPGSHVIIRTQGRPVPPRTLEEAAGLAAYFSRSRQAGRVSVDYTLAKHVRKPPGARPGMVLYDNYRTIYIEPISPNMLATTATGSGAESTGRPTTK
ncbi:MAG: NFACT family protein [Thermanaeromonas sp.]|uniref:Rqc2 family fibronectin-binding protein n=1 Tax=Thermanaeromonas sp. TaxID=2003697 RepID=UPI00243D0600|nr:NFACT RNA binding domain-containing protein [Thermanaeromonas sp.]MCG0276947.1 NFACT family protein [Thermanaeromonas sp.]